MPAQPGPGQRPTTPTSNISHSLCFTLANILHRGVEGSQVCGDSSPLAVTAADYECWSFVNSRWSSIQLIPRNIERVCSDFCVLKCELNYGPLRFQQIDRFIMYRCKVMRGTMVKVNGNVKCMYEYEGVGAGWKSWDRKAEKNGILDASCNHW